MGNKEYRALLDLIMCSDPWPVPDENQKIIEILADKEAMRRGFNNWVIAYHKFKG